MLSSTRLRHSWQRWQSQLYTTEATLRVQLRVQREVLLIGTQNARSRYCGSCAPRAIPLHTSVLLLARLSLRCAECFSTRPKMFLSLGPMARLPYEHCPEQRVRR